MPLATFFDLRNALWPDPKKGPWRLNGRYVLDAEGWRCIDLRVQPVDPSDPAQAVTGTLLRKLRPGAVGEGLRKSQHRQLAYLAEHIVGDESQAAELRAVARSLGKSVDHLVGGRPRELGPEKLAQVARVYREAYLAEGKPTQAVAEKWGVPYSTAARWVGTARRAGLLEATTRGVAGGAIQKRRIKARRAKR